MKTVLITFFQYQGYCSLWIHSTRPDSQPSLLYGNNKVVMWSCAYKKARILAQLLDSPPWECFSSLGAVQQFLDQKTDYWNETFICSLDFGPNCLRLFPRIKSALKEQIFQDRRHPKKLWRRPWKIFHNRSSKNISNSGNIVGLNA
jgi:hypothetical protein